MPWGEIDFRQTQTCLAEGCKKPRWAGKLCAMHKSRLYIHGDINAVDPRDAIRRSKLGEQIVTPEKWDEVKRLDRNFKSGLAIARAVELSPTTVYRILRGEYLRPEPASDH